MSAPQFPPPFPTNRTTLRVYETGTATANFGDNEFAFSHPDRGHQAWSNSILIRAETEDLEFSFDGVNVHGRVPAGSERVYRYRYEGGIAVRGTGSEFTIEAW